MLVLSIVDKCSKYENVYAFLSFLHTEKEQVFEIQSHVMLIFRNQ